MAESARVVVIGSGIAGSSIAYHLTLLGWTDVVILEQGEPVGGTTSHAPGLVGQLRSSVSLTKMLMHSVELYKTLQEDGQSGFFPVGSLRLASSKDRMLELKRQLGFARGVGLPAELLTPRETEKLFPLMSMRGVEGALYLPTDGSARATVLARALARGALSRGAKLLKGREVTGFHIDQGRVKAVLTSQGRIDCEHVVAAAGIWSAQLGRLAGLAVPLVPMEHQYAMTAPLPELKGLSLPNLRDPDHLVYFRQDGESLVLGGYERDPQPFDALVPRGINPTVLGFEPARFESLMAGCLNRMPGLRASPLIKHVNGLESFTPDGEFLLGEAPGLRGFWLACGFCAHGVSGSGGVGKVMAEWIVEGEPSLDLWHMDIRRFASMAGAPAYVKARASEVYATYYDLALPGRERQSARGLRLSPLYSRLGGLGAVFGEKSGWERVNWVASNEARPQGAGAPRPEGWAGRDWSSAICAEHLACRETAALFDETSFSKLEVSGPGSLAFLQKLAANQMDQPLGAVTYTQMLNARGGIECDLTVTRLAEDRFRLITGTAFGLHDRTWIESHAPDRGVLIEDLTERLCCVGLWGPKARDIVAQVSKDDFSNGAFPYMTAREVTVGGVRALALRVTYVGELGWEFYARNEDGPALWDALWGAGRKQGAVAGGYRAIDTLRLEKGYRYWSADIHSEYNPYEAGLGFAVKLAKGDFIGRKALEEVKRVGISRKLCCLTLEDPSAVALGGEPLWLDGQAVGRVTSAGYGYSVGRSIAYGYLPAPRAQAGTKVEVELFGERKTAVVVKEPLFDPAGAKVRA